MKQGMNKIKKIYNLLLGKFGEQGWWPINGRYSPEFKKREKTEREKFEISVGAILTQATNWKNVEKALENLRKNRLLDKEALKKAGEDRIASLIKPAGYYSQKAKKLKGFARYCGEISRDGLLSIWGIGPETADSILLYAYDKPFFVLDAYTKRIMSRLGICRKDIKYGELQDIFHKKLGKNQEVFNEYHALLVNLAKTNCRKKPVCDTCPLRKICPKIN